MSAAPRCAAAPLCCSQWQRPRPWPPAAPCPCASAWFCPQGTRQYGAQLGAEEAERAATLLRAGFTLHTANAEDSTAAAAAARRLIAESGVHFIVGGADAAARAILAATSPAGVIVLNVGADDDLLRASRRAYVTNEISGTVTVIDATKHEVLGSVRLAGGRAKPVGVVVSPDNPRVYVANGHANSISVIDAANGRVLREVSVGRHPWGIAIGR